MVMASVSGSVAMNSVFFWLAKSATARPMLDRKVPTRKETFSRVSNSSATRTASPGVEPSSRNTISSLRPPSTPPLALISSWASCMPLR